MKNFIKACFNSIKACFNSIKACFSGHLVQIILLICISLVCLYLYLSQTHSYLRFSDGAKFADIARNIVAGNGYVSSFNFFNTTVLTIPTPQLFEAHNIPPLFPNSIALIYRLFGVNDVSVVATSSIYYILAVLLSYFIGAKLFSKFVGFLAGITIAVNINMLDYATSAASEIALIFLILLTVFLLIQQKKLYTLVAIGIFFLLYLTRPQAVIFIFGMIIFIALEKTTIKKVIIVTFLMGVAMLLIDKLMIVPLLSRGFQAINAQLFTVSPSETLKGAPSSSSFDYVNIARKLFYNTYNFYRRIPDILSPYLFFTFIIGLFIKERNRLLKNLQLVTLFLVTASVLAAVLTIPFFRYIHPVVPLIYILGCGALFTIITSTKIKYQNVVIFCLLAIFAIGPSLGVLVVDARFKKDQYNFGKAPSYVLLSQELKKHTDADDVVLTNLDTWSSWYGERKSIWLPNSISSVSGLSEKLTVNTIYVTNYLANDENYLLGEDWKALLENPESIKETSLSSFSDYTLVSIEASETYENIDAHGVIFKRKD